MKMNITDARSSAVGCRQEKEENMSHCKHSMICQNLIISSDVICRKTRKMSFKLIFPEARLGKDYVIKDWDN